MEDFTFNSHDYINIIIKYHLSLNEDPESDCPNCYKNYCGKFEFNFVHIS